MDEQILKWKDMWQEQKSSSLNVNELIGRLNQIERNARLQRTKLIIGLVILTLASIIFISELLTNTYFWITYILVITAVLIKLVPLYKTKYATMTDESGFNNHYFIKKLTQKMDFKMKHLLLYMSILLVGLNFALLGAYEKGTLFNYEINDENRIFFHLTTIVLFTVAYIVNKKNMDKNKRNTLKLIADLETNL